MNKKILLSAILMMATAMTAKAQTACDTVQLPYTANFTQCWTTMGGASIIDSNHASVSRFIQRVTSPWFTAPQGNVFVSFSIIRDYDSIWYNFVDSTVSFRMILVNENGTQCVRGSESYQNQSNYNFQFDCEGGLNRIVFAFEGHQQAHLLHLTDVQIWTYPLSMTFEGPSTAQVGDTVNLIAHVTPYEDNPQIMSFSPWSMWQDGEYIYPIDSSTVIATTDSSCTLVFRTAGSYSFCKEVTRYNAFGDHYAYVYDCFGINVSEADTHDCDTVQLPYISNFSQCWTATGGATIVDSSHVSLTSLGQKITSPWMVASAGRYFYHIFLERNENAEYDPNEQIRITIEDENGVFYTDEIWPGYPFGQTVNLPNGLFRMSIEYTGVTPVPSLMATGFAICNYAIDITTVGPSEATIGDTLTYIAHATLQDNDTVDQWDWEIYDQDRNRMRLDDPRLTLIGTTDSSRTFVLNSAGEYHVISRIWKTHYMSNLYILATTQYDSEVYILDTTPCEALSLPYSADFTRCWQTENGAILVNHNRASIPLTGQSIISPWLETEPGMTFVNFRVIRDYDSSWYEDWNEAIRYSLIVQHEDGTVLANGQYGSSASSSYAGFNFRSPGGRIRIMFTHTDSRPTDLFDISDVDIYQYPFELSINAPGIAHVGDTVTISMAASCAPGDSIDYSYLECYSPNGDISYGNPDATILAQNDTSYTLVVNATGGYFWVYAGATKGDLYHNNRVSISDYQCIRVVDFDFCVEDSIYYTSNIKDTIFGCHPKLHDAVLPESVRFIEDYAMYDLANLRSVTIADGLTEIGAGAFAYNYKLATITLPTTVTHIGRYAFGGCSALRHIDLPQSLTTLDGGVFWYCTSLDSLVFPDHIRTLGRNLMDSCISLTYVHLPESMEYIDTSLLRYCTSLQHVDLPQHINRIAGWALMQCHSLESIVVPEGVTSIGETAFYVDYSLSKVHLPSTLTSIGDIAFAYCSQLDTIWVDAAVPPTCTLNTFYNANANATIVVPCGTEEAYRAASGWSLFADIIADCEGIDDVNPDNVNITVHDGQIVIEGAEQNVVTLYDMSGRVLATQQGQDASLRFNVPASGTYLVRIGNHAARKVVVIR